MRTWTSGSFPGAVVLVARHGKVALLETVGVCDPATKVPMTEDTIFRIYSMSKPITSVAAMVLWGGLKVDVEKKDENGKPTLDLVAATRDMTIQDLFRHTSGLTYGFFGPGW